MSKNNFPIFSKSNLSYIREEKDGHWLIQSKHFSFAGKKVINFTLKEILELANGNRNVKEIIKKMNDKYPKISEERIEKDVTKVLAMSSRLGIVEWTEENPYLFTREMYLEDEYYMRIGTEEDIIKIFNFIDEHEEKNEYLNYRNPLFINEKEYSMLGVRVKLFTQREKFFILEKNEEIHGLVVIGLPLQSKKKTAEINLIMVNEKYSADLLQYALSTLPYISIVEVNKITLIKEDINKNIIDENILKNIGFENEAKLENELGFEKNIIRWSYTYNKNYLNKIKNE